MLESRHPMKRLWAPWRRNYIEGGKQGGCIFCEALKQADGPENLIAFRGSQAFERAKIDRGSGNRRRRRPLLGRDGSL